MEKEGSLPKVVSHTSRKWHSWDSDTGLSDSKTLQFYD